MHPRVRARRLALSAIPMVAFVGADLIGSVARAATPYQVTDLGDLPGGQTFGIARRINASGQVAGRGETTGGTRAFLWNPTAPNGLSGSMYDLGTLFGDAGASAAEDINGR